MIALSTAQIEATLPKLKRAVQTYTWLQSRFAHCDISKDREFQRTFNGYYRVRRSSTWQQHFYALLEKHKTAGIQFSNALALLHEATGRIEASFVSKLVATVDPTMPVIDSVVLKNLHLRLPPKGMPYRVAMINEVYEKLISEYASFLMTDVGVYLIRRFTEFYPTADVSRVKMLDFVLWMTRPDHRRTRNR